MHANNEGVGMNAAQLVAAVQNLQQMVAEGQQREAQLRSQVEALANQAQQTAAVGGALPHGVATAFEALASSQKELVESLKGKEKPKLSLVWRSQRSSLERKRCSSTGGRGWKRSSLPPILNLKQCCHGLKKAMLPSLTVWWTTTMEQRRLKTT